MTFGTQLSKLTLAVALSLGIAYPSLAQHPHAQFARQSAPKPPQNPPHPQSTAPHAQQNGGNRPPQNANHPNAQQNPNRPPNSQTNRPPQNNEGDRRAYQNGNATPRQQLGVGAARPWVDRMRDISPAQRESVLQSSRAFQTLRPQQQENIRRQFQRWDRMSPQQRADQRTKEDTWRHLTPQQREHIKYEVLPKWRQMPPERQQAIERRLGILQNMPESARNQRLNDPNFTKGMSEEDRSTLRDLSHLHVGGAPDPPTE